MDSPSDPLSEGILIDHVSHPMVGMTVHQDMSRRERTLTLNVPIGVLLPHKIFWKKAGSSW